MIKITETITNDYKVVVAIPAGRKRYMELLLPQLLREEELIDEIRFCVNTNVAEDLEWMKAQVAANPKITIDGRLGEQPYDAYALRGFWDGLQDPKTIYIRVDDDVLWIQPGFIKSQLDFRVNNPEYLFVYPNLINNCITDHLHMKMGLLDLGEKRIGYDYYDNVGLSDPWVAEKKHRDFLEHIHANRLDEYRFHKWVLTENEKMSINSLCWFGRDLVGIQVAPDEETQISVEIPVSLGKKNAINGNALAVHFAFHHHRATLDETDLVEKYRQAIL